MASPSSPVVSVVIPTYRRAGSIAVAMNSALARTMADLEVIVVDDCSGDGTPEVIRAMADPRVRLIEHDRNRGGNAARRTGITAARGDYLAFLDSDDAWYPPKLELQLARLRELGSGYGLCYTW